VGPAGGGSLGLPGGGVKVAPAGGPGSTSLTPVQLAAAQQAVTTIATAIHAQSKAEIDQVSRPNVVLPDGTTSSFPVNVVRSVPRGFRQLAQLYLGSPEVLALYHLPASALTADVTTSRTDLAQAQLDLGPDPNLLITPNIGLSSQLPSYQSAPNTLISPHYAATLGLSSSPAGWLLQSEHPLTPAEITSARTAAANAGLVIETRDKPDHSLQKLRDYSTGIGVLVALGVLLMTVGLIRSETANDLRTLSAAGASSTTRRTLTAVTAGALALLGSVLGTAGCYVALLAWNLHDLDYLSHPPTVDLLTLILGLPLAATVIAWLAAFRTPTGISHRPLE
jgi:putative ABC transport system permease protein